MTDKTDWLDDAKLDALMRDARDRAPVADAALMARVLADAQEVQAAVRTSAPVSPSRRFSDRLVEALGGWPGLSTLAACACVGLVVGISAPDTVIGYVPSSLSSDLSENTELFVGELALLEEEG